MDLSDPDHAGTVTVSGPFGPSMRASVPRTAFSIVTGSTVCRSKPSTVKSSCGRNVDVDDGVAALHAGELVPLALEPHL
jgi:hypothetical protein